MRFVVLLGVVSLFADMTYEGARGIADPYRAVFGASGTVVGMVAVTSLGTSFRRCPTVRVEYNSSTLGPRAGCPVCGPVGASRRGHPR